MPPDIQQILTDPATADRLDAFVSYKREQSAIAWAIVELLEEKEKVVWLDTEIPLSKNWWDSIKEGINKSSAMIALVTDDYMRSPYCMYEVAYARQQGRLIIVLDLPGRPAHDATFTDEFYHENLTGVQAASGTDENGNQNKIRAQEQWNHLSMIQVVDFSHIPDINGRAPDGESGQEAFRQDVDRLKQAIRPSLPALIKALEYNLAYRETFSKLQRTAEEWQGNDETDETNDSLLLRGSKLQEAEDWLREGRDYREQWQQLGEETAQKRWIPYPPTRLHEEFIDASRQAAINRRRWLTGISVTVAVAMIALALFAFIQRDEAITQRERADIEATRVVEQLNETQNLLQQEATRARELRLSINEPVDDMLVYGPSVWVSLPESNTLQQRRSDTGDLLNTFDTGSRPQPPFVHQRHIIVVADNELLRLAPVLEPSPESLPTEATVDGYRIADNHLWLQSADELLLIDMNTFQIVQQLPLTGDGDLMAATDSHAWLYDDFNNQLVRYSAEGNPPQTLTPDDGVISLVAADDTAWLMQSDGQLQHVAGDVPAIQQTYAIGTAPGELVTDGQFVWAFSSVAQRVLQINLQSGAVERTWDAEQLQGNPLRLDVEGARLWVSTNNAGLRVYDTTTGAQQAVIDTINGLSRTAPVSDGAVTWMGSSLRDNLLALNLDNNEIQMRVSDCPRPTTPQYDGANIWTTCRDSQEILRVPAAITLHLLGDQGEQVNPKAPVIDEPSMWVLLEDAGELAELDMNSGDLLRRIDLQAADDLTDIERDGRFIWILQRTNRRLIRLDPAADLQPEVNPAVWTFSGEPHELMFIDDFLWIPSFFSTGSNLHLFDRTTGEPVTDHKFGLGTGVPAYDEARNTVWIGGGTDNGTLYRMTPDGTIQGSTSLAGLPFFIFVQDEIIYSITLFGADWTQLTANLGEGIEGRIYRLDARSGEVLSERYLPSFPQYITYTGDYLFATEPEMLAPTGEQLKAYDPQTLEPVTGWNVCDVPTKPYYDATHSRLWLACIDLDDRQRSTVLVLDTNTLDIVQQYYDLGRSGWPPRQIDDTIWVVYQQTGNAAVFDARSGELIQLLALGENPSELAVDTQNGIWLANAADSTVQRLQAIYSNQGQSSQ